jgi:MYXO-CTERM domain-containing protein
VCRAGACESLQPVADAEAPPPDAAAIPADGGLLPPDAEVSSPDAGVRPDVMPSLDAGLPGDAGKPLADGALPPDAPLADAAGPANDGARLDPDVSAADLAVVDRGIAPDAPSSEVDVGGGRGDGGGDALSEGAEPDNGGGVSQFARGSGCQCRSAGEPGAPGLWAAGLLLLRWRRRRPSGKT